MWIGPISRPPTNFRFVGSTFFSTIRSSNWMFAPSTARIMTGRAAGSAPASGKNISVQGRSSTVPSGVGVMVLNSSRTRSLCQMAGLSASQSSGAK